MLGADVSSLQRSVDLFHYSDTWADPGNLANVLTDMRTRYGKPVIVAETAYQFTTADADSQGNSIPGTTLCDNRPAT